MKPSPTTAAMQAADELHDLSEHIRALLRRIDRLERQTRRRNLTERRYRHLMKALLPET
ncbi:hypothetical protein PA598K_07059 [Paenibacillus sp. 598K]|uniref:hypothetical protein n=1 Tax=Paenibacillus sp. 598K TaxID=1117987 RepID=UPI000FFA48F4|nr:hypothetical protein [Paenibacillus sp. 598K]GBF78419.1 hypothetical protein PA598K_07059 [Paenibacillus sp. 598K]